MSRRVATITLNPAYDLVGFTPEIERGEVNLVRTTGLHAAGKGINVAKVLKDLGIDVTVGGFLGSEYERSKLYDPSFTTEFRQAKTSESEKPDLGGETR